MKNIPKFFQVGTVIEGNEGGFISSKISKKEKKSNLANELIEIDR